MIMVLLTLSALQFRSFSAVAARTRGYHLPPSRGQTLRCFTLSSQVSRGSTHPCLLPHMNLRGGSQDGDYNQSKTREFSSPIRSGDQKYVKLSDPAPGSRKFVTDVIVISLIQEAKHFYGDILGCQEGRSSEKWQDYSLHGHQIVCHWVGDDYKCIDYYNPVDGDEVPVPHAGLALTVDEFHALSKRVKDAGIKFIIEPHLRFQGMPGEQWTMFFKDPSGNNLEFKAMTKVENLFAKYNVVD
eukprot:scaffold119942_cov76-Cyclotella_meneghiniana.AAC.3